MKPTSEMDSTHQIGLASRNSGHFGHVELQKWAPQKFSHISGKTMKTQKLSWNSVQMAVFDNLVVSITPHDLKHTIQIMAPGDTRHTVTKTQQHQKLIKKGCHKNPAYSFSLGDDESSSESISFPLLSSELPVSLLSSLSLFWKCQTPRFSISSERVGGSGIMRPVNWPSKRSTAIAWAHPPIGRRPPWQEHSVSWSFAGAPLNKRNTSRASRGEKRDFKPETFIKRVCGLLWYKNFMFASNSDQKVTYGAASFSLHKDHTRMFEFHPQTLLAQVFPPLLVRNEQTFRFWEFACSFRISWVAFGFHFDDRF